MKRIIPREARLRPPSGPVQLEPMRINDTTTYSNFFDFPAEGAWVVLHIARPNRPSDDASFEYKP